MDSGICLGNASSSTFRTSKHTKRTSRNIVNYLVTRCLVQAVSLSRDPWLPRVDELLKSTREFTSGDGYGFRITLRATLRSCNSGYPHTEVSLVTVLYIRV